MKTKEAIEHIKHKYVAYDDEYCAGTEECEKLYKQQDEVIELLKRGKKYEQIFKEFKKHWFKLKRDYYTNGTIVIYVETLEEFEQKYL